jgi:DNA-binding response OmpR family regulator
MRRRKIVIVEDETDILELVRFNLEREGFCVLPATDGEAGLAIIREETPDLVILDLMLPGLDGIEVCRLLKAHPATEPIPIVMVTAKTDESDVVLGLSVGADDYVTKPFSSKELVARVRAVLRRVGLQASDGRSRISRNGFLLDVDRHEIRVNGAPVPFTATEFRLLHCLASRPGKVFTREALLKRVVGEDAYVLDRNIDVHVRAIRKKLREHRELVETVRGVGYRFRNGTT